MNLTGDIPAGILKGCDDSYISIFTKILNTSLERGCFPNQLKLLEVTPVFKKEVEAVAQTCSGKKVLLEISQNSRENTCARVSFLVKLQATGVFLLIL